MPKGKKQCPSCNEFTTVRASSCKCGLVFEKKKKKEAKPFFQERKEFIKRMLDGEKSQDMILDMTTVTKIFNKFNNDVDFLSKVKPPFKLNGSIRYFLTTDGMLFLDKKYKEYQYKPKKADKVIDLNEKFGEDLVENKPKTLRNFLNNE
jgi:hypothetical protein